MQRPCLLVREERQVTGSQQKEMKSYPCFRLHTAQWATRKKNGDNYGFAWRCAVLDNTAQSTTGNLTPLRLMYVDAWPYVRHMKNVFHWGNFPLIDWILRYTLWTGFEFESSRRHYNLVKYGTFRDQKNLIRIRGVLSGERVVCQKVNLTKPEFLILEDAVSLCDCRVASLQNVLWGHMQLSQ